MSHPEVSRTVKGKPGSVSFLFILRALLLLSLVVLRRFLLSTPNSRKAHRSSIHRHSTDTRRHSRSSTSGQCSHSSGNCTCRGSHRGHTCSYNPIDVLSDCASRCSNSGIATGDNNISCHGYSANSQDRGLSAVDGGYGRSSQRCHLHGGGVDRKHTGCCIDNGDCASAGDDGIGCHDGTHGLLRDHCLNGWGRTVDRPGSVCNDTDCGGDSYLS